MSEVQQPNVFNSKDFLIRYTIPHVTGGLSMLGSGWIMVEVLLDGEKRKMSYHRIMFGLSFFDFFSSMGFFMSNWAQPNLDDPLFYWSKYGMGTIETCNATGFAIYLGSIAIPLYSAAISLYYHLVICHGWSEQRIKRKFELYVHSLVPLSGIIIATLPLILKLYNPWFFYCFAVRSDLPGRSRNQKASDIFELLPLLTVFFSAMSIIYSMGSIISKVNKTFERSDAYDLTAIPKRKFCYCCSKSYENNDISYMPRYASTRQTMKLRQRAKGVRKMAFLYLVPFFITWVLPTFLFFIIFLDFRFRLYEASYPRDLAIEVYISVFLPLQGFMNWFVYLYHRFQLRKSKCNNTLSYLLFIKIVGEIFLRLLNLNSTKDDGDCYLGSGMEIIDFEEDGMNDVELNTRTFNNIENDRKEHTFKLESSILIDEDGSFHDRKDRSFKLGSSTLIDEDGSFYDRKDNSFKLGSSIRIDEGEF